MPLTKAHVKPAHLRPLKRFVTHGQRLVRPAYISPPHVDAYGIVDTDQRQIIQGFAIVKPTIPISVEPDTTKLAIKDLTSIASTISSGHSHIIMKTNTSYVRAVNDYTLSSHELHAQLFNTSPTAQAIISISNAPYTEIDNLNAAVGKFILLDQLYEIVNHSDVSFYDDEVSDDRNSQPEYCVYKQQVINYRREGILDKYAITIEYLGTPRVISATVLGNDQATVNSIANFIKQYKNQIKTYVEPRKEKTFYTIAASNTGFRLEDLNIKSPHLEEIIDQNYNDDFRAVDMVIHDSISNDKRGLILLHGAPGTGKTSYIKHLITGDSERKIVYIPTHLASAIASPQFISFVKKELTNSVLVIEDAEQVLLSRESFESQKEAVSNILNMTDGILADALNILIICTFNTDTKNLDTALLRKGRLLLNYKFDNLNETKTNALALKLYGKEVLKSLPLSEIYNLEYDLITPAEPAKHKFGFVS